MSDDCVEIKHRLYLDILDNCAKGIAEEIFLANRVFLFSGYSTGMPLADRRRCAAPLMRKLAGELLANLRALRGERLTRHGRRNLRAAIDSELAAGARRMKGGLERVLAKHPGRASGRLVDQLHALFKKHDNFLDLVEFEPLSWNDAIRYAVGELPETSVVLYDEIVRADRMTAPNEEWGDFDKYVPAVDGPVAMLTLASAPHSVTVTGPVAAADRHWQLRPARLHGRLSETEAGRYWLDVRKIICAEHWKPSRASDTDGSRSAEVDLFGAELDAALGL